MVAEHAAQQRKSPWPWVGAALFGIVLMVFFLWLFLGSRSAGSAAQSDGQTSAEAVAAEESGHPQATELEAPQSDPSPAVDSDSCLIRLVGEDTADGNEKPLIAKKGELFPHLPLLTSDTEVFAGWYETEEAARELDRTARVNMSREVACEDQEINLYPAWVSAERNAEEEAHIPVLMYHWFTEDPEGEDHWLSSNFLYVGDFEDHLKYIKDEQFYLPTWPELSAFIDGKLFLPSESVILTDDDGHKTWYKLAVPLVEENQVMFTSFVVGARGVGPEVTQYVQKRSHTNEMHEAGENGQGRMVNWTQEEIVADMLESAEMIGGAKEVMAYPYGHNDENAWAALTEAGWDLARTVDYGYVTIGTNKLALPTVRINYGMGVDALAAAIG